MHKTYAIVSYLTRERERQGKSQADVVRASGLSKASISEWEKHRKDPSASNLMKWALALDCRIIVLNNSYAVHDDPDKCEHGIDYAEECAECDKLTAEANSAGAYTPNEIGIYFRGKRAGGG